MKIYWFSLKYQHKNNSDIKQQLKIVIRRNLKKK